MFRDIVKAPHTVVDLDPSLKYLDLDFMRNRGSGIHIL